MQAFRITIAFLFVALILAIALTGCSTPRTLEQNDNCVRWINGECVEVKIIPCTTDIDCQNKNGGEY